MLGTAVGRIILLGGRRYLLRHTFSGAALTPSDLGPPLTVGSGTPTVSGGVVAKTDATDLILIATALGANIAMQSRVNFGSGAGTRILRYRLRHTGNTGNLIEAVLRRTGSLEINRRDAFAVTQLATVAFTVADSTDYWMRVTVQGSRIELLTSTDGSVFTSRLVATESTYASQQDIALILSDNAATPTTQGDDLLVWAA